MAKDDANVIPAFRVRPSKTPTRFLYVANAGPRVGDTTDAVAETFSRFGEVTSVDVADPTKARCLVTMALRTAAEAAQGALQGRACESLGGRKLWVQFSDAPQWVAPVGGEGEPVDTSDAKNGDRRQEESWCAAVRESSALGVPGCTLVKDFVTPDEEAEILAVTDRDPRWQRLAKRRVIHYGYAFDYGTRNARAASEPIPECIRRLLTRAAALGNTGVEGAERASACDQLTVNEYTAGIGLAPHIDTHSAFGPTLLSVSLAGHAAMEFRLHSEGQGQGKGRGQDGDGGNNGNGDDGNSGGGGYADGDGDGDAKGTKDNDGDGDNEDQPKVPDILHNHNNNNHHGHRAPTPVARASILLPPRSLLVLTGEARYRWQHYIPHRKRDVIAGEEECVYREPRRVSLTFRETRTGPCECQWPDGCDSRMGAAQLLKERARPGAVAAAKAAAAAEKGPAGPGV